MDYTDELSTILNINKIDIAAVSKTWFPANIDTGHFDIPGFNLYSRPRKHKRGGGVALYVRESIQTIHLQIINVPDELEVQWIWVRSPRLPRTVSGLLVAVLYHPPSSPYEDLIIEHLVTTLDTLQTKYPSSGIAILGDFNKLDTDTICRFTGLVQVVNAPTRGQVILDKILTNLKSHYNVPQITSPIGLSDHSTVLRLHFNYSHKSNAIQRRTVRPLRDSDKRQFGQWITSFDWNDPQQQVLK
ncbi:uncharacterized protein [Asterias amurensis]|uniref:uncharacterized protein n=1 Tax=Asterias amurensis TaxID=7602 RepID=UPI003AB46450